MNSYVLALVRATLEEDERSWVPPYRMVRWVKKQAHVINIAGHYRRKAMHARTVQTINCVCKLEDLVVPVASDKLPRNVSWPVELPRK